MVRLLFVALSIAWPALAAWPEAPLHAVAVTQARGASGTPTGLWLHRLPPPGSTAPERSVRLPGLNSASPLFVVPALDEAWLTVSGMDEESTQAAASLVPFRLLRELPVPINAPAITLASGYATLDDRSMAMLLFSPDAPALFASPRGLAAAGPYAREAMRRELAEPLVGLMAFGPGKTAMVQSTNAGLRLSILGLVDAPAQLVADLAPTPTPPLRMGMAGDADGRMVAVAAACTTTAPGDPERTTVWIVPADSALGAPVAQLDARGTLCDHAQALAFSGPTTLWCVSRSEETRFGYISQWCLVNATLTAPGHWEKSAEHIVPDFPPDALSTPTGTPLDGVLVAKGAELTLWTGAGALWSRTFPAPIGALAASGGTFCVGAGNSVMWLGQDGQPLHAQLLDTGHVVALTLADLDTSLAPPDADADGIDDDLDPEPGKVSPQLVAPEFVTLSGRAAGHELRAMLLQSPNGAPLTWKAAHDPMAAPWLRVFPEAGNERTPVYVAVDPVASRQGIPGNAVLSIAAFDAQTGIEAAGSPALVKVVVSTSPRASRQVLWLLSPQDTGARYEAARQLTSAPPLYFSETLHQGPFASDLGQTSVVVLPMDSAAKGALSQRDALDFITAGGALLLVPATGKADLGYLSHWGAPLGLDAKPDGTVLLDGAEIIEGSGAAYGWRRKSLGLGRVALLDTPALLEQPSPESPAALRALFNWLGEAGRHPEDLDADGIPDNIEDTNGDGKTTPDETNPLAPDTDTDGLPDGMEDRNANGHVDPGETDPRNPDSDGDTIRDAGDPTPVPV